MRVKLISQPACSALVDMREEESLRRMVVLAGMRTDRSMRAVRASFCGRGYVPLPETEKFTDGNGRKRGGLCRPGRGCEGEQTTEAVSVTL